MANKKFSKDLYAANDGPAKACAVEHLIRQPAVEEVWINEERYGADVKYTYSPNSTLAYLEAEIKTVWPGGPFNYPTVQVLGRKKKYFEKGTDLILCSANHQDYLIIPHSVILSSPIKSIRNKYNFSGEDFYVVELSRCIQKRFDEVVTTQSAFCCGDFRLKRINTNQFQCTACQAVKSV